MTPVGEILVSLMDGVHSELGLPELLCQDAARRLPVRGAGLALMDDTGVVNFAVASDPFSLDLETRQLTMGEGPCVEAWTTGRLVLLPDLGAIAPSRWPAYAPSVMASGVRAIFSYPLQVGGIRLGVLDLFSMNTGMLDDDDLGLALHYVDAAVVILLHLQSLGDLLQHTLGDPLGSGPLEHAFGTGSEVHQATGMVSIQAGVSLTEALLLLRDRAHAEGLTLVEAATAVVSRTLRFN